MLEHYLLANVRELSVLFKMKNYFYILLLCFALTGCEYFNQDEKPFSVACKGAGLLTLEDGRSGRVNYREKISESKTYEFKKEKGTRTIEGKSKAYDEWVAIENAKDRIVPEPLSRYGDKVINSSSIEVNVTKNEISITRMYDQPAYMEKGTKYLGTYQLRKMTINRLNGEWVISEILDMLPYGTDQINRTREAVSGICEVVSKNKI